MLNPFSRKSTNSGHGAHLADAIVYATSYINLKEDDDDDVGALESIAGALSDASDEEKDMLAAAAKRALAEERKGSNREDWIADLSSWMEDMFPGEWEGNERLK